MTFEDFITRYQVTNREYELMEQAWLEGWYCGRTEGYTDGYDTGHRIGFDEAFETFTMQQIKQLQQENTKLRNLINSQSQNFVTYRDGPRGIKTY